MVFTFQSCKVVVAGASRGIARAIALEFARRVPPYRFAHAGSKRSKPPGRSCRR